MAALTVAALLLATPAPLLPATEGGRSRSWMLAVRLSFESAEEVASFHNLSAPLITYVRGQEPDTLSFAVLESDANPLAVMVLERYTDKAHAYEEVHRKSAPFLDFKPKLNELNPMINGSSYDQSGVGFYARNSTAMTATAWCLAAGFAFETEEQVAKMLQAVQPLADYIWEKEPTTLGFAVMRSDQDPRKILIFERYADQAAYVSIHRTSDPFMAFQRELEAIGPLVNEMEPFREAPQWSVEREVRGAVR